MAGWQDRTVHRVYIYIYIMTGWQEDSPPYARGMLRHRQMAGWQHRTVHHIYIYTHIYNDSMAGGQSAIRQGHATSPPAFCPSNFSFCESDRSGHPCSNAAASRSSSLSVMPRNAAARACLFFFLFLFFLSDGHTSGRSSHGGLARRAAPA